MSESNDLIREGLAAYKAGDKAQARQYFEEAVKADENNPHAWYYLAGLEPDREQRVKMLQRALQLDPGHEKARAALEKLEEPAAPHEPSASAAPAAAGGGGEAVAPSIGGVKMPVEIPGAPEKITFSELVGSAVSLLRNSVGIFLKRGSAYQDEIRRASWWRFWLTLFTGSVVVALVTAVGSLLLEVRLSILFSQIGGASYTMDILQPILSFIFSIPITMVAIAAGSYASHWWATSRQGGRASLVEHSQVVAAAWLPGSIANALLGAVMFVVGGAGVESFIAILFGGGSAALGGLAVVLFIVLVIVSIGLSIYILTIMAGGFRALYRFEGGEVWTTLIILLLANGVVFGVLSSILPV